MIFMKKEAILVFSLLVVSALFIFGCQIPVGSQGGWAPYEEDTSEITDIYEYRDSPEYMRYCADNPLDPQCPGYLLPELVVSAERDKPGYEFDVVQASDEIRRGLGDAGSDESLEDYGFESAEPVSTGVNTGKKTPETFAQMKERAREELCRDGITSEQREAYTYWVSERLYAGVTPFGYYKVKEKLLELSKSLFKERVLKGSGLEDAWRLYLGLPQQHNTFGISEFRPANSQDNIYYYNLNSYVSSLKEIDARNIEALIQIKESSAKGPSSDLLWVYEVYNSLEEAEESLKVTSLERLVKLVQKNGGIFSGDDFGGISPVLSDEGEILMMVSVLMAHYKLSLGQDEKGHYLSYYDVWDLDVPLEKGGGFFGKPFEIYDRIYYDPETFEIIEEPESEKDPCR